MAAGRMNRSIAVTWSPPPEEWVKINSDGSLFPESHRAACGGILRDHQGRFLAGYSVKLGNCSILKAELWGMLHGIKIAKDRGYNKVLLESDSEVAIGLLNKGCRPHHPCSPLVHEILQVVGQDQNFHWRHVYREANSTADSFAKNGISMLTDFRLFESPPPPFCIIPFMFDFCNTLFLRS